MVSEHLRVIFGIQKITERSQGPGQIANKILISEFKQAGRIASRHQPVPGFFAFHPVVDSMVGISSPTHANSRLGYISGVAQDMHKLGIAESNTAPSQNFYEYSGTGPRNHLTD